MRTPPFLRGGATLLICVALLSTSAASAQSQVRVPGVPTVTTPSLPDVTSDPVGTVNDTTGQVTDTVNETVGDVQDTIANPTNGTPVGGGSPGGSPGTGSPSAPAGGGSSSGSSPSGGGSSSGGGSTSDGGNNSSGSPSARGSRATGRRSRARRAQRRRAAADRATQRTADRRGDASDGGRRAAASGSPRGTAEAGERRGDTSSGRGAEPSNNPVVRVIERIERVVPGPIKIAIAVLALLALALGIRSRLELARTRRLERHGKELLADVGVLQRALLAEVPDALPGIDVSVAYRPADGPAAGGDFYDVFELAGGRTALIVGDVCGHGRAALAVTALMRYTLRAYMGAGLTPRVALQVAGRSLESDPGSALTTAVLAVYDPDAGTLTYACAGHAPPIVSGPCAFDPVTTFSSPPLGGFMPTGQRQTTIGLPPGSAACFFTDGLVEARLDDELVGRDRLAEFVADLEPEAGAQALVDHLAARADQTPDDMAACVVRAQADAADGPAVRIEELDADAADLEGGHVTDFLCACGADDRAVAEAVRMARAHAAEFGAATLRVVAEASACRIEVVPREPARAPTHTVDGIQRVAALDVSA